MAVTPYLRLQKPPFDSIPWDQAINGNMDILDSTIAQYLSIPNFGGSWANATNYTVGQVILDATTATLWQCNVSHTSAIAPTTFAQDRSTNPTYWTNITTAPAVQGNVGRNLIHNPLFNVAQRGVSGFITTGYTLDRWRLDITLDAVTLFQTQFGDSQRAVIGDEEANNCLAVTVVGNAGATAFTLVSQSIENVRRLASKTVTISFWASVSSGTAKVGVGLRQTFGSGGSPSPTLDFNAVPVTLSTTPTRYTVTATLPSITGKTLGTNNDHATRLGLYLSSGATANTIAGGIGVQSATFIFWGVQLEIGSVVTPLEKPDPQQDLAKCQRFYQAAKLITAGYSAVAGQTIYMSSNFPVTMRAIPIIAVPDASGSGNSVYGSSGCYTTSGIWITGTTVGTGTYVLAIGYNLSADLTGT